MKKIATQLLGNNKIFATKGLGKTEFEAYENTNNITYFLRFSKTKNLTLHPQFQSPVPMLIIVAQHIVCRTHTNTISTVVVATDRIHQSCVKQLDRSLSLHAINHKLITTFVE